MKPLEHLRVLDLTRFLAGPYCTLLLGGLGAEVIKIEPPGKGEGHRDRPPYAGPQGASLSKQTDDDIGLMVLHRARNKKSVTLNLRSAQGIELFKQLCRQADVVVENYSPGTLDKMGLSFASLQEVNPRLIVCSISGFGQTGPYSEWRAYDPIIQAMGGINSVTGFPDRQPVRCGAAISDTTAPLFGVIGILSALQLRDKTGRGEWVDISMQDGTFFFLPELVEYLNAGEIPVRRGNSHIGGAPFNVYDASDGHVSVCAVTARGWENCLRAIGREDLKDDPRYAHLSNRVKNRAEVDQLMQDWMAQHTVAEAVAILQAHEVPSSPVLDPQQLLEDEHLAARDMVVPLSHPTHGPMPGVKGFGMPIKFVENPVRFDQPAPELGAHNAEVYGHLLGLADDRLQALKDQGVI